MLMTEEEARTKWCPMARVYDGGDGEFVAINRPYQSHDRVRCYAASCMGWRVPTHVPPLKDAAGLVANKDKRGYCGAFGRPEV